MSNQPIAIRKALLDDARLIAEVHVDSWRTTYARIVAASYLDALSVDERTTAWESPLSDVTDARSEILVAETRGAIVGFIAGGPRRTRSKDYDAQLHALYLRPEAQGQGAGRKLATMWATAVVARGFHGAVVDVLAANPARTFYQRLGAQYLEDIEVVIGDKTHLEARYGWTNLRALAGE
jgi:ribosomal protein S18 acetylase RimI-like enzyme